MEIRLEELANQTTSHEAQFLRIIGRLNMVQWIICHNGNAICYDKALEPIGESIMFAEIAKKYFPDEQTLIILTDC